MTAARLCPRALQTRPELLRVFSLPMQNPVQAGLSVSGGDPGLSQHFGKMLYIFDCTYMYFTSSCRFVVGMALR